MPSDLRTLQQFPSKSIRPDLEKRRAELSKWLKDAVSKVSLHVCDAAASHATAAFLGMQAGTYLAHPEELNEPHDTPLKAPSPIVVGGLRRVQQSSIEPEELSNSLGSYVLMQRADAQGAAYPPEQPGAAPTFEHPQERVVSPRISEELHDTRTQAAKGMSPLRASSSTVLDARPEATLREKLCEALALHSEGLISESDLLFAQKAAIDNVVADGRPAIAKMRELKALQTEGILSTERFNAAKQQVLSSALSP